MVARWFKIIEEAKDALKFASQTRDLFEEKNEDLSYFDKSLKNKTRDILYSGWKDSVQRTLTKQ